MNYFCSMVSGAVYQRQSQYPVNPLRAAPTTPPPTMRYYRLWIYTCNALLFISVLGFCIVAAKVLVFDPRRLLVPYLSLTQPSFLYAYAALIFQSGLLQLIGCLGAQRLNEKLLNVYWLLILVLLLGDVLLGVVWLFRFDRIATELKPWLEQSLARSYGVDAQFTTLWDAIQTQYRCCGANGHNDFPIFNHTLDAGPTLINGTTSMPIVVLPSSCCRERPLVAAAFRNRMVHTISSTTTTAAPIEAPALLARKTAGSTTISPLSAHLRCITGGTVHRDSCHEKILTWLIHTAHILFVIGYCVIAFIKLCFLGILRYEIREMIQKIKLVQESNEKAEGDISKCAKQNNGTILQAPQQQNNIVRESIDSPVGRVSGPGKRHVSTVLTQAADAGTDSDTNSHCALILCDGPESGGGANGNNNYEMGEIPARARTRT
ncbi:uncharacterized protein isoform X2 [Rhodnius prolixus]|uniref:uncharacterized protein isoform X2 n=1 Tax=Rhodnius prolixus TaxID=13249 RepID=UPI003D18AF2A